MDPTEHRDLTSIIRGVHEKLRKSMMTINDSEKVWAEHVKDEELRKQYSKAMYKLATDVWKDKETRIKWTYETCINYFYNGHLDRSLLRHMKIIEYSKGCCYSRSFEGNKYYVPENNYRNLNRKLNLLDVGSCYNPFSKFTEFNCTAIDLTPATPDVLQVDFLYLDIKHKDQNYSCDNNNQSAELFLEESFDIVVLSLVLEYLPDCKQRLMFCYKSWQLLQENGLLIIITPDSKSVNHNTDMMKSWKLALEKIGFFRVKYEKLEHIHCMAFRKLRKKLNEMVDMDLLSHHFYIPQDFKAYSEEEHIIERNEDEDIQICNNFSELPNDC